jgi:hypothetical protein
MDCGQRYFLEKIAHVPEIPAFWFAGGRAVHEVTERWDLEGFNDAMVDLVWAEVFNKEIEDQQQRFPDVSKWRTAGKKKNLPDGEDYLRWMELGPQFVRKYIEWRTETNWSVWDGAIDGFDSDTGEVEYFGLACELPLDFELHGWKFKGSIDRVFTHPDTGDLIVVDIKTGSRMPESDLQLGTYAVGTELQYGERPKWGAYYNPRLGKLSALYNLSGYTIDSLGQMGVQFKTAVQNKVFLPHKTNLCNWCSVNNACAAFGGKDAHLYTIEKVLNG